MKALEANFDGLVGPTHNYSGLSFGNVASAKNQAVPSKPKQAAKQGGLAKMKALSDMGGMVQGGVLAPQERPDVKTLRQLGFTGSDKAVIEQAAKQAPKGAGSLLLGFKYVDSQCGNGIAIGRYG